MTPIHLIDLLDRARVEAPAPDHVSCQTVSLALERRAALYQHPDSRLAFPPLAVGSPARFEAWVGMKSYAWTRHGAPVRLSVLAGRGSAAASTVLAVTLDPRRDPTHRAWLPVSAALPDGPGALEIVLIAQVEDGGSGAYAWTCWGEPRVLGPRAPRPPRARPHPHPHVILISADALRRDHLGLHGHPRVKTPHLDALAARGLALERARAVSPSTLASYASLLTGLYPARHGIDAEWGALDPTVDSLPGLLGRAGYRSLLVPGEEELGQTATGVPGRFDETIPTLGKPAQPGALTTRRFLRWLDEGPTRPSFVWLEYFDTHPPSLAPTPWRDRHYAGDPRREPPGPSAFSLREIYGVESSAAIDLALPWLRAGRIDDELAYRLACTARGLAGGPGTAPDLAAHLLALGPASWARTDRARFAAWLADRAAALGEGRFVDPDLVDWLVRLRGQLVRIEADILSWLDGVRDPRFPLSQYEASVGYFDACVGELVARLEADGLFESTTLVVTSPHGELLGEGGVWFHHHTLLEAALSVPLLIKPGHTPAGAPIAFRPGSRPGGDFALVDLLPTLASMWGLPIPPGLDGTSRWAELSRGAPVPEHPCFAAGIGHLLLSVRAGDRALLAARGETRLSASWEFVRGERRLVDPGGDERLDLTDREPDRAAELGARLEARARAWGYPLLPRT